MLFQVNPLEVQGEDAGAWGRCAGAMYQKSENEVGTSRNSFGATREKWMPLRPFCCRQRGAVIGGTGDFFRCRGKENLQKVLLLRRSSLRGGIFFKFSDGIIELVPQIGEMLPHDGTGKGTLGFVTMP